MIYKVNCLLSWMDEHVKSFEYTFVSVNKHFLTQDGIPLTFVPIPPGREGIPLEYGPPATWLVLPLDHELPDPLTHASSPRPQATWPIPLEHLTCHQTMNHLACFLSRPWISLSPWPVHPDHGRPNPTPSPEHYDRHLWKHYLPSYYIRGLHFQFQWVNSSWTSLKGRNRFVVWTVKDSRLEM